MEGPAEGDIIVQRIRTDREIWEVRRRGSTAKPQGRLVTDAPTLDQAKSLACEAAERGRIWIEGEAGQFTPHDVEVSCGPGQFKSLFEIYGYDKPQFEPGKPKVFKEPDEKRTRRMLARVSSVVNPPG